jgi:tripartite-type tricarboxylate transporter receptor subunit TctC
MSIDLHLPLLEIRRRELLRAGAAAAVLPFAASAFAQTPVFPTRPIRLLVGYAPGGGVDTVARLLAPHLSATLGQPVVIENRAGASGTIAADQVARSSPDGYTLLVGETSLLISKFLRRRQTFDPSKSFSTVAGLFKLPLIIVANNNFAAKTPAELIATLKAHPGHYSFGSPGIGTVQHLAFELFKKRADLFVVHIPYRGAAQIIPDVISGQVALGVVTAAAAIAQAKGGGLRALAIMSTEKVAGAEDVPPLADALKGFEAAPGLFLLQHR